MKKFAKSLGGKILLFCLCLLLAAVAVGSGVLTAVLVSEDVYNRTEQELINNAAKSLAYQESEDLITEALNAVQHPALLNDRGNLEFIVLDSAGGILAYSQKAYQSQRSEFFYSVTYRLHDELSESWLENEPSGPELANDYTVRIAFTEGLPETDVYALCFTCIHLVYILRYALFFIGVAALILSVFCFVQLMGAAGRRKTDDGLYPGPLYRVPFDLLIALCAALAAVTALPLREIPDLILIALMALYAVICGGAVLGLCMSAAVRIKSGTLWKNTLIYYILCLLWCFVCLLARAAAKLPLVWRTVLLLLGSVIVSLAILFIALEKSSMIGAFLWLVWTIFVCVVVLYIALCLRRLQKSGEALAAGALDYHTDTHGLPFALKRHGENLNSIALGMNAAVEQRLKSERMKTELITNVSHDLKTPLTSVINYAGLIAKEPCQDPKITGYAEVLTRQSERLKRLIEDLVEASKASTGNLEVNLAPCDAAIFLAQATGEYTQRLADHDLTLITRQPEEPVRIKADGRRMWRIFDNLLNNICKYAQPNTRVYLTLEVVSGTAVITFRNTSREQLNIIEEELMERFVRADTSRSTEGNGLGLAIARSLAELQGGSLRLFIDGDLFKAILVFPLTAEE